MKVTVLLPTWNEELSVGHTIRDVQNHAPSHRIVVVDSYSTDRTVEVAKEHGADVMMVPERGKGIAIRTALDRLKGDGAVVMLDSDYTYPAQYIQGIVDLLEKGYDVVMGYRTVLQKGAMTHLNRVGNRALSGLAGILYGFPVKDVCTGLWGFQGRVLDNFRLTSSGFTLEADLFCNAVTTGCRIAQIPIHYRARLPGSASKLQVRHGAEIAWFLVKNRWMWDI